MDDHSVDGASISIYTVGYGSRPMPRFLTMLTLYNVQSVCDVRSTPFSKRFPDFSRPALFSRLKRDGIEYCFLGDALGARPSSSSLYEAGRASYKLIANSVLFRSGLDLLLQIAKRSRTAILCAELDPLNCHRAILIGRELRTRGVVVAHIGVDGALEAQADFDTRLVERYGLKQGRLFDEGAIEDDVALAYDRRSEELAFCADAADHTESSA